jgi:hypothetical protein
MILQGEGLHSMTSESQLEESSSVNSKIIAVGSQNTQIQRTALFTPNTAFTGPSN